MTNPEIGRSIDVDGYKTNYHDVGEGAPVVLVHGSGPGVTAWANWRLVMPELAKTRRVIALDMLGFGYTDPVRDGGYTVAAWQAHLRGFLDALGLEKVSLIGNSFGGGMSLRLAYEAPERVDRLVLMGSGGVKRDKLSEGLKVVWGYTPSVANMRAVFETMAYDKSLVSDELAEMRYQASIRPGVHEEFARMFQPLSVERSQAIAMEDAQLASIKHEALIIHGREDRVVPLANGLKLNELLENSQLHVFGKCGHWTMIEKNRDFVRLAGDFLPS